MSAGEVMNAHCSRLRAATRSAMTHANALGLMATPVDARATTAMIFRTGLYELMVQYAAWRRVSGQASSGGDAARVVAGIAQDAVDSLLGDEDVAAVAGASGFGPAANDDAGDREE